MSGGGHQREYSLGIKSSSLPSRPQGGNIRWDEISLPGRQLRPVMPRPEMSSMPGQGISSRTGYNSIVVSGGLKSLNMRTSPPRKGNETGDD